MRLMYLAVLSSFAVTQGHSVRNSFAKRQSPCSDATQVPCSAAALGVDTTGFLASDVSLGTTAAMANQMNQFGEAFKGLSKRHLAGRQAEFCCPSSSECRSFSLAETTVPMCYDHATTSFTFPDGTHGQASTGELVLPQGDTYNLNTGEYRLQNGTTGNYMSEYAQATAVEVTSTRVTSATGSARSSSTTTSLSASASGSGATSASQVTSGTKNVRVGGLSLSSSAGITAIMACILYWPF